MIKARGCTETGRQCVVLGFSFANLDRLRAGDPIWFDGTPYGFAGDVMIFAGRNEQVMAEMIRNDNPGITEYAERDAP